MKVLKLGERKLSLEEVRQVAVEGRKVELSTTAQKRIDAARAFLEKRLKSGEVIYGVNTGFGLLSNVRIEKAQIEELQINLLRSHAVGVGDPIPEHWTRAMLLLRASTLAQGHSGVRTVLVKQILECLNRGVTPLIPSQGSVGASGDLAPLSHLALVLLGEGKAHWKGKIVSGAEALAKAGLKPIRLQAKEGLALINGTQFMTAIGSMVLLEAEHLADLADGVGALSVEALRGTIAAFRKEIHEVRPHPGQKWVAARMRKFLGDSKPSQIALSHADCDRVQDPYSLRCIPQVHGASRDALKYVREVLEREVNSVTDNPLVFPQSDAILSGGNFHGQCVAIAMDLLCIAVAELGSISEQRIQKLINPAFSELPAFLAPEGGLNSGFMIVQVAAASVVSESKTLCHPASVDSIPTSADKEDHVSMGAWAARKAARVVTNSRRIMAMEMVTVAQAIDLLRPLRSTQPLEALHSKIREYSRKMERDHSPHDEMVSLEVAIQQGKFASLV